MTAARSLAAAGRASASEPLRRFLQAARGAGLRVSAAEGIDAARAVDLVGFVDRTLLKDTLGLIIAKTPDEKAIYDQTFELFFGRDNYAAGRTEEGRPDGVPGLSGGQADSRALGGDDSSSPSLTDLLEGEERGALAMAMEAAAREVGVEQIRHLTQQNRYVRQIMDRMGLQEVEAQIAALRENGNADDADRARQLDARVQQLWDAAKDLVERNVMLFAKPESERLRERMLKSIRLTNIDPQHHERMRVLVRQMAKRLATRHAMQRRRFRRGQLDVRRTLRRNMGWGGVPFITTWKQRRIERPRLIVLCDVSGSVAWVAQFLLMFLYALTEVLSDIRSYAYSGYLVEVSEIMEHEPIDEAIERIMMTIGLGTSNYGQSLADFEDKWMDHLTSKSTVIILGDARGNGTDPRTDVLGRIAQRAKRVLWLNPEPLSAWGTGDSDIYRYMPYCSLVRVCSTLNDLDRVIGDLLEEFG